MAKTEVWFRSPSMFPLELLEQRQFRVAWDRGHLRKFNIDPHQWMNLYLQQFPWEMMLVGEQGATHYTAGSKPGNPKAVYPVWLADTDDYGTLLQMIEHPIGENQDICNDTSIESSIRPVFGQDHIVVITNTPRGSTGESNGLIRQLQGIMEAYPDVKLHLHDNSRSWDVMFNNGFHSVSAAPFKGATDKRLFHPGGGMLDWDRMTTMWIELLGFQFMDMKVHRNRVMYNIRSAIWASQNWNQDVKFQVRKTKRAKAKVDPNAVAGATPTGGRVIMGNAQASIGDKFVCNSCTLAMSCKFFRLGAVCSVPGAEPVKLSEMFQTRNAEKIVDGLTHVLGTQANRFQQGMEAEADEKVLDPEVTKIGHQLFNNGVKLAQLLDPKYRPAGVKVQINNGVPPAVGTSSPNMIIAEAIRELEARGIAIDDITPELLQSVLPAIAASTPTHKVIEGEVK